MPPQAGVFNLAYPSAHPSKTRLHNEHSTKKRKRTERETQQVREELSRIYIDTIHAAKEEAVILSQDPYLSPLYNLRLYPLTVEKLARLAQAEFEEQYGVECSRTACEEEMETVEDEVRKGREKIRIRMLEGIEDRRRRAREEKDGEGINDATVDSQARLHVTRKLRNQFNPSPPPTPPSSTPAAPSAGQAALTSTNPNSLSIDELPSPFPLSLTAGVTVGGQSGNGNGRRKAKGGAAHQMYAVGGPGKAMQFLTGGKEVEVESDLGEIRKGTKRRRQAAIFK